MCETWRRVLGCGLALLKFKKDLVTSAVETCFQFVAGNDAGTSVFLCMRVQRENNPFTAVLACVLKKGGAQNDTRRPNAAKVLGSVWT